MQYNGKYYEGKRGKFIFTFGCFLIFSKIYYLINIRKKGGGQKCRFCLLTKVLAEYKKELFRQYGIKEIGFTTISCPSAFPEHSPYYFVDIKEEFEDAIEKAYQNF